jgi:7-cyano-7-deazaguanine reductase
MTTTKPQLGAETEYPESYDPALLVSIPRNEGRSRLSIARPMYGWDIWTGYELSWLNPGGKPQVAMAEFRVDANSASIVESKSFKLYLNSLNQEVFDSIEALRACLHRDLSAGFGGNLAIELSSLQNAASAPLKGFQGVCLDDLDVSCTDYQPNPELLQTGGGQVETETLFSHLLKTNCPVTGQPDWASVAVTYSGASIDREGLLRYLVSYRQHQDFHENCVESLFADILARCAPENLSVYARYTRRGGLDINPFRSTEKQMPESCRIARQ